MVAKKTYKEFIKDIYDLVGDEYTVISKDYKDNKTKVRMRHNCKECNYYEWDIKPNVFKNGRRCPECAKKNSATKRTIDPKIYEIRLKEKQPMIKLLEEYKGADKPLKFKCLNCNYEGESTGYKLENYGCGNCAHNHKYTTDEIKDIIQKLDNEYILAPNFEYERQSEKLKLIHKNCNKPYEVTLSNFRQGSRCPKCAKLKVIEDTLSKRAENFIKKFNNEDDCKDYEILSEYKTLHDKIKFKHLKCGKIFEMAPSNFIYQHQRCPHCYKSRSKAEDDIYNLINNLYNKRIITNDRNVLDGLELDIYLPEDKIAFEYDGLYWHSEDKVGKLYHLLKHEKCIQKGIKLITIFEDEWEYKQDIVESKIKHIIKANYNLPKVYARNCIVKTIDNNSKKLFLDKNHIQGSDRSSIKLGLYNNNKLVAVMTFCKPRKALGQNSSDGVYELSRFATDINMRVIGGFDKLIMYFKKNYQWNKIITYADKRWSQGDLYIKSNSGFKLTNDSDPNYWYFVGKKRFHRYSFRKSELKKKEEFKSIYDEFINKGKTDKEITEFMIMDETKYNRIWDCGMLKFEVENL